MPPSLQEQHSEVRIEESCQEVDRLRREVTAWLDHRGDRDDVGRHRSQLQALRTVLLGVIGKIEDDLSAVRGTDPPRSVYRRCRDDDERTVFVRRFWTFFRDKFDQRDDPALEPVVAAADEIVWSCYSEAFRAKGAEPLSAPLPYVEPQFSPRALRRSFPPPEVAAAEDDIFGDALRSLPLPLIGIPSVCVARPWWLIFLAHESGHQVQSDLDGGSLRISFGDQLGAAVASAGGAAAAKEATWRSWSWEVFADAVSALAVGASAAEAMSDLEAGDERGELRGTSSYPPALVRRALMVGLAGAQPANGAPSLDPEKLRERARAAGAAAADEARAALDAATATGDDADAVDSARAYLAAIPEVVRMLTCDPLDGDATLPVLCGCQPGHRGRVETWHADFTAPADPFPEATRESARLAIAGAYRAWRELAGRPREARVKAQENLQERILATVPRCREPAVRAMPTTAAATLESVAAAISERVFADVRAEDS